VVVSFKFRCILFDVVFLKTTLLNFSLETGLSHVELTFGDTDCGFGIFLSFFFKKKAAIARWQGSPSSSTSKFFPFPRDPCEQQRKRRKEQGSSKL
jgi:hypothetical protein